MKDYRRYHCDENKLIDYGFKKQGHNYIYKKDILDGDFRIEVIINDILEAKVYDSDTDEEYTNIRLVGKQGKFVQKVRQAYEECIEDILTHCFVYDYFIFPQSKRLVHLIEEKYHVLPDHPFKDGDSFVFRNNDKWFGLIMHTDYSKFLDKQGEVECLNIKVPIDTVDHPSIYPAFHMNKKHWMSILLDETLSDEDIMSLIDQSYQTTVVCDDWVIPASPKRFDLIQAFNQSDTIRWHQKGNIHQDAIVYIYYGAPYSAIMYKCQVIESDETSMLLKRLKTYDPSFYPLEVLKKYQLRAIRSARHIPKELKEYIGNTDK